MNWFFWAYFIPSVTVALLAAFMPARNYEKLPRFLIGLAAPIAIINSTVFTDHPGDLGDIPISLSLDLITILIVNIMLRMRNNIIVLGIFLTSILSVILTILRLNTDVQILIANFMEIATVVNTVFITQLFLVALLSFEYMLYRKGWMGSPPVNYFKLAREKAERDERIRNKSPRNPTPWRKP